MAKPAKRITPGDVGELRQMLESHFHWMIVAHSSSLPAEQRANIQATFRPVMDALESINANNAGAVREKRD